MQPFELAQRAMFEGTRGIVLTSLAVDTVFNVAERPDFSDHPILRDDLAGFITHPAPTPPQLESGTTT